MSGTTGTGGTVSDAELVERYPSAALDHDNKEQWRGFLDRRLLINRCLDCGHWFNPPRPMCPRCWSERVEAQPVSGRGRVQWFTLLHHGSPGAGPDTTYPAVVVELEEGHHLRFTSTVVGCRPEEIVCDMAVEVTWQDGTGAPIPVFRPR
jgi:uncharacterized protein